ncbi:MAG: hypothetical protein R3F53_02780 [Gammaproteobacteria bacterium]
MRLDEREEINIVGKWWVPGREQSPHPGTLEFSKDIGPTLRLFDKLRFLSKPENGTYTNRSFDELFPIVCGRTENGPATLINYQLGRADFLILDALFNSEDEARFSRIQLQFQHFPEWVRQPIIERTATFWENDQKKPIGNELCYQYRSLPTETFSAHALNFRIIFGINTKGGCFVPITITPLVLLEISTELPKSIVEWWCDVVKPMRDLLSLAIDRPIDVSQFIAFDDREIENPRKCRVYFKGRKTEATHKELNVNDMLFAKTDIDGGIKTLVDNWFRITQELPMVCNLYSSVTSIREQYLEEEFINLAQAAELYHRSKFDNGILPKKEWKDKVKRIIDAVPESERKWLSEKLMWSNQLTLQSRLEELLEKLGPATSLLIADKKDFATRVRRTRNYLTHWDERGEKNAARDLELYFVSTTLKYILAACLLSELGFSKDKISDLFKRNHRIHNFRWNSDNPISSKPGQIGESAYFTISVPQEPASDN